MSERIDGGDIVVRLVVDSSQATANIEKFGKTAAEKIEGAGAIIGNALKVFGAAAILNGIKNTALAPADMGEQLQNASRRFGTSVKNISRLQYAAKKLGIDFGSLAAGMKFVAKNAVEADQGNGELQKAFNDLGVSVKDANGQFKDGHTLLMDTLTKLDGVTNSTEQTRLAMQLLGRSGDELKGLSAEIKNAAIESDALNNTWSAEEAAKADAYGDSIDALTASFKGLVREGLTPALPALTATADAFTSILSGKIGLKDFIDIATNGIASWASNRAIAEQGATDALLPWQMYAATLGTVVDQTTNDFSVPPKKAKEAADKVVEELERAKWAFADFSKGVGGGSKMSGFDTELAGPSKSGQVLQDQASIMHAIFLTNEEKRKGAILDAQAVEDSAILALASQQKTDAILSGFGSIAEGMGIMAKNNKALFIFQQGLSIVQMISDATAGWTRSFAQMGWAGFALGAAIFARIMMMVQQVRAMKGPSEPRMEIPGAAEGGIAMKPQVVAVAEYGRPEVIAPLDKFEKMIGSGRQTMTVKVSDKPAFLRALAFELKTVMVEENI